MFVKQERYRVTPSFFLAAAVFATSLLFFSCGGEAPDELPEPEEHAVDPNSPGVREIGPARYEAVVYAYEGGFDPSEVRVPVGAEVRFRATSRDDLHGLLIEDTNVELELFPGNFAEASYTFTSPGEYQFLCHVYCGGSHDLMRGRVVVENRPVAREASDSHNRANIRGDDA